jgi:hypothetical protein
MIIYKAKGQPENEAVKLFLVIRIMSGFLKYRNQGIFPLSSLTCHLSLMVACMDTTKKCCLEKKTWTVGGI